MLLGNMGIQLNLPFSRINLNQEQLFQELISKISKLVSQDLSSLRGRRAVYCSGGRSMQPISSLSGKSLGEPNFFNNDITSTLVVGIDSSSLPVCDLEDGSIIAVRASTVFSSNGGPMAYLRLGPYPYHVTPEFVMSKFCVNRETLASSIAEDKALSQSLLRKALERSILAALLSYLKDSIVLVDGTFGYGVSSLELEEKRMLALARQKNNTILGFTKVSRIRNLCDAASSLFSIKGAPFYIKSPKIAVKHSPEIELILAKFRDDGFVFRLDIPKETGINVLERLSANDHFDRGYPDSLRLAHHFCVFTQHEDTCLKSRLGNEFDLVEVPSDDQRQAILGWMWSAGRRPK
ncbi:MAG: DNA double-strand break repair nuclease NurA [Thaumarchaeota archaeon]|nr:DNA double-strand break repair nuclease NurA [Nitrososphaerota archaeon]